MSFMPSKLPTREALLVEERDNFSMDKEAFLEFLKFINYIMEEFKESENLPSGDKFVEVVKKLVSEELGGSYSEDDLEKLINSEEIHISNQMMFFRGVNLWMFISSIYFHGKGVYCTLGGKKVLPNVYKEFSRRIFGKELEESYKGKNVEIKRALASSNLWLAVSYAFSWHGMGSYDEFNNVFKRIIEDNKDNIDEGVTVPSDLPKYFMYPFVIFYLIDNEKLNDHGVFLFSTRAKKFVEVFPENGEVTIAKATIKELCDILELTEEQLKEEFPILYSRLTNNKYE